MFSPQQGVKNSVAVRLIVTMKDDVFAHGYMDIWQ